jgi:hypothetical protein
VVNTPACVPAGISSANSTIVAVARSPLSVASVSFVDDGRTLTRMVSMRIRRTLRELLLQEGTPEAEIGAELRRLEELLER